jgi:hypothetical protein
MNIKHALLATTAAVLLTTGYAQAQSNAPAARDNSTGGVTAPATPSTAAPSMNSSSSASGSAALGAATLHEIKDTKIKVSSFNNVTVKDLNDYAVYGSDGKKIGEIDRVLGDSSNAPKAVAVDAGGFLGMGTHEVVFPLDKLSKGDKNKQLKTALSKDDVKALEKWDSASADVKKSSNTASGAGGQSSTTIPKR